MEEGSGTKILYVQIGLDPVRWTNDGNETVLVGEKEFKYKIYFEILENMEYASGVNHDLRSNEGKSE